MISAPAAVSRSRVTAPSSSNPHKIPQAGMGIASLVLAVIAIVNIGLFIVVILTANATFHASREEESPFNYLLGTWFFAIGLLCVCGIVFGIGGMRQTQRRHSMALAGLCLNIGIPLLMMFMLVLAATASPGFSSSQRASSDASSSSPTLAAVFTFLAVVMAVLLGMRIHKKYFSASRFSSRSDNLTACRTCGKEIPVTSRFCRRCGSALSAGDARTGSPANSV